MRIGTMNYAAAMIAGIATCLLLLAACNGDGGDGSPDGNGGTGSPVPTTVITPGSGTSPIQALGTLINANGLDGHVLDFTKPVQCELTAVPPTPTAEPEPDETPPTLSTVGRVSLGQFCVTVTDLVPEESTNVTIDIPGGDEVWQGHLTFDTSTGQWTVEKLDKVEG